MSLLLWVRVPTLLAIWWNRLVRRNSQTRTELRRSFIVFRLDALGDLVLTTPLFRELKRNYPRSHLTVVAQDTYKSVLITNPHIDELLTVRPVRSAWLPKGARNLMGALRCYWQQLHRREFDVAICPRWDTDEHLATLLCVLTRADFRVGYTECTSAGKRRDNAGFNRAFDLYLDAGPLRHEVLRNLAALERLGGTVRDTALEIHLTSEDREYARHVLQDVRDGELVLALGIGAQSPGRRWPIERYAACVSDLADDIPLKVILTCAPAEHHDAAFLAAMITGQAIISDTPEIRETCALLERCDLYIGNDTGAAHLAAAMGCPALVISRHPRSGDPVHPNSPLRFAPYGPKAHVLQPEHGLDHCTARCTHPEPHCILQISVPEVFSAAHAMLSSTERKNQHLGATLA